MPAPRRLRRAPDAAEVGATGEARDASAGVLITFPLSHYCEKARWALDHAGVTYRERGYAPALHKLAVHRHDSPTAPVLVGRETLRGSSDIARFADRSCPAGRSLLPRDDDARREAVELMTHFDDALGPPARRWFYAWALADPARLFQFGACGLGPAQRGMLRVLAPAIARLIAGRLELDDDSAAWSRDRVDEQLALVSARLADGRDYLCAGRFTAADLTFAALIGPLLHAPGYGGARFALPPIPDDLAPQIHEWRATPAGRHALRVYRDHRTTDRP